MKKCILFLKFFLLIQLNFAFGQSNFLNQKITLSFEDIQLEELLEILENSHKLHFSYSIDNTPLTKKISVHAHEMPAPIFLEMLCFKAGLSYHIVDDQIVLREIEKTGHQQQTREESMPTDITNAKDLTKQKIVAGSAQPNTKTDNIPVELLAPIPPKDSLKEAIAIAPKPAVSNLTTTRYINFRPRHFRNKISPSLALGITVSYDHFLPNFKERPNPNQKFAQEKNYSFGLVGIISPGEIFSGTFGLLLAKKDYFLDYNYKLSQTKDPIAFPKQTKVYLSYLEFPFTLNYRLLEWERFSVHLSAGITTAFLLKETESTSYMNAEEEKSAFFQGNNANFLLGGSMGILLWYPLGKSFHLFFRGEGVHYFTGRNNAIMKSPPRLLKANTGISIRMKN